MSYIGRGISYPHDVDTYGRIKLATGLELIRQSVYDVIDTPVGSLEMNPLYGSHIHELIHEPNDDILQSLLEYFVREAITKWEKRVSYRNTLFEFTTQPEVVNMLVHYDIVSINQEDNFVYPFYRKLEY